MRGSRAKSIRKYVSDNFPMLNSLPTQYVMSVDGVIKVRPSTSRGVYQQIKRAYKKQQRGF